MKHRQGDVMLRLVKKPANLKRAEKGEEVLALGEHTGHGHVTVDCEVYKGETGTKYIIPKDRSKAALLHRHLTSEAKADHDPIMLNVEIAEDECYEVVIQERYNPFTQLFERVQD